MNAPVQTDATRRTRGAVELARDRAPFVCVRGNQAGIDGESIGSDQLFGHAALNDGLELTFSYHSTIRRGMVNVPIFDGQD
jgi:hypothetical protein